MKPARTKRGIGQDGPTVAGPGYEVNCFGIKHGITRADARKLIGQIGTDRQKLNSAA